MIDRFKSKYEKQNNGCWLWIAAKDRDGYGQFHIGNKQFKAHRVSWFIKNGVIKPKHVVDHLCRNRSCVNPKHLRTVTCAVNALNNNIGPSAINAVKTHCINGHEFNNKNTLSFKRKDNSSNRTRRVCRVCSKLRQRKYRARSANS